MACLPLFFSFRGDRRSTGLIAFTPINARANKKSDRTRLHRRRLIFRANARGIGKRYKLFLLVYLGTRRELTGRTRSRCVTIGRSPSDGRNIGIACVSVRSLSISSLFAPCIVPFHAREFSILYPIHLFFFRLVFHDVPFRTLFETWKRYKNGSYQFSIEPDSNETDSRDAISIIICKHARECIQLYALLSDWYVCEVVTLVRLNNDHIHSWPMI